MAKAKKSGHVTFAVGAQRYTAYYVVEDGKLTVSNEIGTLTAPYSGGSAPHQAQQLLARLVREERGARS
jgi:hypothetical protein